MQPKIFLALSLLSTASAQAPVDLVGALITANPAQVSQLSDDLGSYFSSVVTQPAFSSVVSVLATGLPQSIIDGLGSNPAAFFGQAATDTQVLAVLTRLPSDVQSYLSSIGMVEISIVTKDLGAGAVGGATATGASATGSGASATGSTGALLSALTASSTMATVTAAATGSTMTSVAVLGTASTGASNKPSAATTSPSTTSSKAAAPSTVAMKAAGLLVAAGALGIALL
ncbi:hypothetical protein MMC30_003655 [Trapelia coarctata]|nr:hypothetical protein [Trapelia coarctata]